MKKKPKLPRFHICKCGHDVTDHVNRTGKGTCVPPTPCNCCRCKDFTSIKKKKPKCICGKVLHHKGEHKDWEKAEFCAQTGLDMDGKPYTGFQLRTTDTMKIPPWDKDIRRCGFCSSYLLFAKDGKLYCNHCYKEQYVVKPF